MNGSLLDGILLKAKIDDLRARLEDARREYERLKEIPKVSEEDLASIPDVAPGIIFTPDGRMMERAHVANRQANIQRVLSEMEGLEQELEDWQSSTRFTGIQSRQKEAQEQMRQKDVERQPEREQRRVMVQQRRAKEDLRPDILAAEDEEAMRRLRLRFAHPTLSDKQVERLARDAFEKEQAKLYAQGAYGKTREELGLHARGMPGPPQVESSAPMPRLPIKPSRPIPPTPPKRRGSSAPIDVAFDSMKRNVEEQDEEGKPGEGEQ